MLELYYNLLDKYCEGTKFEQLEMDTDLLLRLSGHKLFDCIRPAMTKVWNFLQRGHCIDESNYQPNQQGFFYLVLAALSIRSLIDENLGYSTKNSTAQK